MATKVLNDLDFNSVSRITNLLTPVSNSEPATKSYVDSAVEGLSWKASCRVATASNINLSSPSSTLDGVSIVQGDRILVRGQTTQSQNGIYLFDTGSSPLVRSADASTFKELEQAVVTVEEGTSAATTFRQTQLNGVIGTNNIVWEAFGTSAPSASESTAGIAEIATQSEVDTGTDDLRFITPLKLASWGSRIRKFTTNIGDGSATSYTVTHNFNTRNVQVSVFYNSGNYDDVLVDVQRSSVNAVTIIFSTAPTSNQFSVVVIG